MPDRLPGIAEQAQRRDLPPFCVFRACQHLLHFASPTAFIRCHPMTEYLLHALWVGLFLLVHAGFVARAILRPHREPASRVAWVVVMIGLPIVGILAYLLVGETSIGRRRVGRMCEVLARLPAPEQALGWKSASIQPEI